MYRELLTETGGERYYSQTGAAVDHLLQSMKMASFVSESSHPDPMPEVSSFVETFKKAKSQADIAGMVLLSAFGPHTNSE